MIFVIVLKIWEQVVQFPYFCKEDFVDRENDFYNFSPENMQSAIESFKFLSYILFCFFFQIRRRMPLPLLQLRFREAF